MDDQTHEIKEEDIPEPTLYYDPRFYTPREVELIQLITWGYSNEDIANEMSIAIGTVKNHKVRIKQRLDAPSTNRVAFDFMRYNHKQELERLANAMVGL